MSAAMCENVEVSTQADDLDLAGLGPRIVRARIDKGMDRPARLAEAAGIDAATLANIETGLRATRPSAIHLLAIARACGVTVEWLLTGKDSGTSLATADSYDLAIEVVRRSVDPVAFDEFRSTHSNRYPSDLARVAGVIGLANMMRDDFERAQRGVVAVGRVKQIDMDAEAPIAAVWRAEAAAKGVAKKTKGK